MKVELSMIYGSFIYGDDYGGNEWDEWTYIAIVGDGRITDDDIYSLRNLLKHVWVQWAAIVPTDCPRTSVERWY